MTISELEHLFSIAMLMTILQHLGSDVLCNTRVVQTVLKSPGSFKDESNDF